jgi:hypothetical protein
VLNEIKSKEWIRRLPENFRDANSILGALFSERGNSETREGHGRPVPAMESGGPPLVAAGRSFPHQTLRWFRRHDLSQEFHVGVVDNP